MKPLRILLVDDSRLFRDSAATLLSTFDGVEIVGQVASAAEAFKRLKGDPPDLVLMDISMPHVSGIEATARIKGHPHAPRVVLVTSHTEPEYRAAATAAGADGFIVKECFIESISALISQLHDSRSQASGG